MSRRKRERGKHTQNVTSRVQDFPSMHYYLCRSTCGEGETNAFDRCRGRRVSERQRDVETEREIKRETPSYPSSSNHVYARDDGGNSIFSPPFIYCLLRKYLAKAAVPPPPRPLSVNYIPPILRSIRGAPAVKRGAPRERERHNAAGRAEGQERARTRMEGRGG